MGCNCGGSTYSTPLSAGSGWAVAAQTPSSVWEVTFPDGTSREYTSDTEAYRAVRAKGGGIRQKAIA